MKLYTKSIQVAMLAAAAAVMAAGCADSRVASKENLTVALNHDYPPALARLAEGEEWALPAGAYSSCGGPL